MNGTNEIYVNRINKTCISGVIYVTGMLLIIGGAVLDVFYGLKPLGVMCWLVGYSIMILYFGFTTRGYIGKKNSTGKKLKICYAVGFFVVVIGVVLMLIQGNSFLSQEAFYGRFLISCGLLGMCIYLVHIHNLIKKANSV